MLLNTDRICSRFLLILYLLIIQMIYSTADTLAQVVDGEIGGGNYSYYSLTRVGHVVLMLESIQGDADLYCSSKIKSPTYHLEKHELQSTSCGVDRVDISSLLKRPVTIGVYGHPSHFVSKYRMIVFWNEHDEEEFKMDLQYDIPTTVEESSRSPAKYDYSVLEIIGSILQFALEILVDVLM